MSDDERPLEIATRLMLKTAAEGLYFGTKETPHDPWPWEAKEAIRGAEALLSAWRERTGAREERGQDVSDELLADLRRAVHFAVSVSDADGKLVWQPVLDRVLVVEFQRARVAGKGE